MYFLGIGVLDNTLGMITSAYGTYNVTTGTPRFIALTEDAEGNSIVMEYYLHNGADWSVLNFTAPRRKCRGASHFSKSRTSRMMYAEEID